jgi:hypothetical protein
MGAFASFIEIIVVYVESEHIIMARAKTITYDAPGNEYIKDTHLFLNLFWLNP